MLCVVSPNPFAAMLLQEGHTVLMPSRSRQLSRAVSSAIQRVHVGSIRYKQLNGVHVSRNRGGVKRGSPFMVVGRGNEDSMWRAVAELEPATVQRLFSAYYLNSYPSKGTVSE
jgi:hypothetical protein